MAELRLSKNAHSVRDAQFIERVKATLKLSAEIPLEFRAAIPSAEGGYVIEYSTVEQVIVHDADLGIASGVTVEERAVVELRFDASGGLVSHRIKLSDERHLQLVKDNIRKLAAANAIAPAPPNARMSIERKPWYIETDAAGHKRLKRAHFS